MTRRPEYGADCPGCPTGWTVGDLLCPWCERAVHAAMPALYPAWLKARADHVSSVLADEPQPMEQHAASIERQAYTRGIIVGAAMMLNHTRRHRKP